MKNFYIPEGIAEDYCYIVPSNNYYDVYNTNYLNANSSYIFYRFYNNLDSDMYLPMERITNNYNYGSLECIQVNPMHSYIYRKDFSDICLTSFIIIFGIIVLFNIVTSIIKKGGLLSGLI